MKSRKKGFTFFKLNKTVEGLINIENVDYLVYNNIGSSNNIVNEIKEKLTQTEHNIKEESILSYKNSNLLKEINYFDKGSFNVDEFYHDCFYIIKRYLIIYKILLKYLTQNKNKQNDNLKKNKNKDILYKLINKNKFIYNNKFIFDYDNESIIDTSSDDEILIKKKNENIKYFNKEIFNYIKSDKNNNNNKYNINKYEQKKIKNEQIKINILDRYPIFLRDLIKIIKCSKKQQKTYMHIKVLKMLNKKKNINKINKMFYKKFLFKYYEKSKKNLKRKQNRKIYRIIRYNLLNFIYNNHDTFIETLFKNTKQKYMKYNDKSIEQFLTPHVCNNIGTDIFSSEKNDIKKTKKFCNICKEQINITFSQLFYNNYNYKLNSKAEKKKHLFSHIFSDNNISININYEIKYHKDEYIYIASKKNVFCNILHNEFLNDNFNDLLIRIKNGGIGYKMLNVIFNKNKNNFFLNKNKLKKNLEKNNKKNPILLKKFFYDVLKQNILNINDNTQSLTDYIFEIFYKCFFINNSYNRSNSLTPNTEKSQYNNENILSDDDKYSYILNSLSEISETEINLKKETKKEKEKCIKNNEENIIKENHQLSNAIQFILSNVNNMDIKEKNNKYYTLMDLTKKYINLKKMTDIYECYINDIWNTNFYNYYYISCPKKENTNNNNTNNINITNYLNNLDYENAILIDSDDSFEDLKDKDNSKISYIYNILKEQKKNKKDYFKKLTEFSIDEYFVKKKGNANNNSHILLKIKSATSCIKKKEVKKLINLKKNYIIHPLLNSKNIGFKVEIKNSHNRDIDIYCINDGVYMNIYENSLGYLKNFMNKAILDKYLYYYKLKMNMKTKNPKERKDLLRNIYNTKNNLINEGKNQIIKEYILVIEENIEEDKYKIDIYNYASLTTYITESKEEKKRNFFDNFLKNNIYTYKWIENIQTKLANYSNFYSNVNINTKEYVFLKGYIKNIKNTISFNSYKLLNAYYCLSDINKPFNVNKKYSLDHIANNIIDMYNYLKTNINIDLRNYNQEFYKNIYIDQNKMQYKYNKLLLFYRCNNKYKHFYNNIIEKYKNIFLYYLLYIYPKFLYIYNIIQIKSFKNKLTISSTIKKHDKLEELNLSYAKGEKNMDIINDYKPNMEKKKKKFNNSFFPTFKTKNNNLCHSILDLFYLNDLLLIDSKYEINNFFIIILRERNVLNNYINFIHPLCFKILSYCIKNNLINILLNILKIEELANIFHILNIYICFVNKSSLNFNKNKLLTYFHYIETDSFAYMNDAKDGLDEQIPIEFKESFVKKFLITHDLHYTFSYDHKIKLLIYIILIQLLLTNNKLPVNLLVNEWYLKYLNEINLKLKDNIISYNFI